MRVPHTFAIDDMPESERPRRTIFHNRQPDTEPAESADPASPQVTIAHSDRIVPRRIVIDVLRPFSEARAALSALFRQFQHDRGGPP